jgi:hypothetical protein
MRILDVEFYEFGNRHTFRCYLTRTRLRDSDVDDFAVDQAVSTHARDFPAAPALAIRVSFNLRAHARQHRHCKDGRLNPSTNGNGR